jgi:hypothetical protein
MTPFSSLPLSIPPEGADILRSIPSTESPSSRLQHCETGSNNMLELELLIYHVAPLACGQLSAPRCEC